jgi:ribonuclease P protein component
MREPPNLGSEEKAQPNALAGPLVRLKKRADFLKAAKGQRTHARSFSLQAVRRKSETEPGPPRFGFTVTKKTGGATVRNRIRRRLKEALRLLPNLSARPGHDYVILGREAALSQEFAALRDELAHAITEVHASAGAARNRPPRAAKPRRPPVCAATSPKKD